jgi:hypothetical protein
LSRYVFINFLRIWFAPKIGTDFDRLKKQNSYLYFSRSHPWLKIQALLRLMTPFVAVVRLLIASLFARATIAIGEAVAAITFALLVAVLNVGTIARPILRGHCCNAKDTTCEQDNRSPCSYDISHGFLFLVNGFEP